jgi:hypothetical protein
MVDRHTTTAAAGMPRRPGAAVVEPLEGRQLMSVVFALQAKNVVVAFDHAAPGTALATHRVTNLQRRENLLGLDFRPADGRLYAVGSSNTLYTIDIPTGRAAAVGAGTFAVPLNGTRFGIDFDPFADRLRVVSDADQNLRLIPGSGAALDAEPDVPGVQADADLAFDAADPNAGRNPAVIAAAYAGDVATPDAAPATLYGIDATHDVLVRHGSPGGAPVSPDAGTLFTVGALGVDAELVGGGFDVLAGDAGGTALAALSTDVRRPSQLYTVDLGTGAATPVGNIARGRRPTLDIAAAPAGTRLVAVTARGVLLAFNTAVPSLVLARSRIRGFASRRERVVGVDVRPATGQLWALTDADRLYTLDPATGAASAAGEASATVGLAARAASGFDFDPATDRVRVVNAAGQNVRFDPVTGAAVDSDVADPDVDPDIGLAYAPGDPRLGIAPRVVAAAHSNNVAAASSTTLYVIDSAQNALATQGSVGGTPTSPNTGQLFSVGPSGIDVPDRVGFDIVTRAGTDTALAVFARPGSRATSVYSVNLITGAMTLISDLDRRARHVVAVAIVVGP